jgi:hypothetical protein
LTDLPPIDDTDLFDEAGYLRLYPGIAEAMMRGEVDTAWNHFCHHGRDEGRRPNDVDPEFYLSSYADIERDLGRQPTQADAAPHYIALGRARGYRPNAAAPRVINGAAQPSPFGGLWIDHANALDLIQGRLDLGRIRPKDAEMLRAFAREGFVELNEAVDREQMHDAALFVDQAFTGMFPDLRFEVDAGGIEARPWQPELTEQHVAALDPHMMSRRVRDLLLDDAVTKFLSSLFDSRTRLVASRAFLREACTPERDVTWNAISLPLQFVAVTFGLEDGDTGADLAWPGSHRLRDLPWPGGHVTVSEARRAGTRGLERSLAEREERVRALVHGHDPCRFPTRFGTRMIRHANLIHAAEPPEAPSQRRSITAWYSPIFAIPGYMEATPARTHVQNDVAFSSGCYPNMEPRD